MKVTKKQPVKIALTHPDGTRIEARIPLWKAYAIMAELEREKELKQLLTNQEK